MLRRINRAIRQITIKANMASLDFQPPERLQQFRMRGLPRFEQCVGLPQFGLGLIALSLRLLQSPEPQLCLGYGGIALDG